MSINQSKAAQKNSDQNNKQATQFGSGNNTEFKNRVYGLVIIKSELSNWNADFTGYPRRLPDEDATIYATDKALKYAIRNYWVEKGKTVFVWRSRLSDGKLMTRDQRMEYIKSILPHEFSKQIEEIINDKSFKKDLYTKNKDKDEKEIDNLFKSEGGKYLLNKLKEVKDDYKDNKELKNTAKEILALYKFENNLKIFSSCIDTKLFGITFTGETPTDLTGPVQISYGINGLVNNTVFVDGILSPYPTGDDSTQGGSIGKESKVLESYYVYDFSVNPKNLTTHYEDNETLKSMLKITEEDISDLKEALKKAATNLNTTSKQGSDNVMLLWVEVDDDKVLPNMKSLVKITKGNDGKAIVDLSQVMEVLESKGVRNNAEVYAEKSLIDVVGVEGKDVEDL